MSDFSYHLSTVHYLMLRDSLRTDTYLKAINKYVNSDDFVIDLGSGSGILSFFASKNAKKVYSVEITKLINEAQKIADMNKFKNIIFINKDIFNLELEEKLDVIIHEQIGDYLWDEDLINKVSGIKKNFLKKNGIILPNVIELYLVPSNYKHYAENVIKYWDSKPYGIDFSILKKATFKERINDYLHPFKIKLKNSDTYLSSPKIVYSLNLSKDDFLTREIKTSFLLNKNDEITGIIGFMKVKFSDDLFFYTNHYNENGKLTHWNQFFIPLFSPKKINRKTELTFTLYPNIEPKKWKWSFEFK